MFRYRPGIDPPPEWQSIDRALVCSWCGVALPLAAGAAAALQAAPAWLLNTSLAPALVAYGALALTGSLKLRAIRKRMEEDFQALGATRQFTFVGGMIPIKYNHHYRDVWGRKRTKEDIWFPFPWVKDGPGVTDPRAVRPPEPLHQRRWTMQWVPYSVEHYTFRGHDGKQYGYFRKKLILPRGQVFRDRKEWLRRYYPQRWECVRSWWIEYYIVPELVAMFGPEWENKSSSSDHQAVAERHECELLMGVAVACEPSWWSRRIGYGHEFYYIPVLQGRLQELPKETPTIPPDDPLPPLPTFPVATHVFMGKGFKWETRHTQAYELMKMRDVSEVTEQTPDQGNPLVYGTGLHDETMIFCDMANINQHVGIFGSTGVGKTRYVEPLIVQMIRSGYPVIIIDPKGDADLTNRTFEEARACGRGHQLRYYSLVLPKNRNVCTYNPLHHYNDPTFLGARVGAVIPNTKDPFWKEEAIKTSREILTLCHWMREYLRFIDRDPATKELPPRYSSRVPKLLLMMQIARKQPEMGPEAAEAMVDDLIRQVDSGSYPEDPHLLSVVRLMQDRRYAPVEWNPTVRQVTAWGIDNTVQFVGWALKILQFHAFLGNDTQAQVNYPEIAQDSDIKGMGGSTSMRGPSSMWTVHKNCLNHPLLAVGDPDVLLLPQHKVWVPYFEYMLGGLSSEDRARAQEIIDRYRSQLDSVYTMAAQEREKFLEKISTLSAAMSRFRGARERIVCAQDPDLTWDRVVDEDLIVYCGLGQMVDADGANGVAKMMIQDIASFIGEVYNFRNGKEKPFVLICDEIASFINEPMIDLLNKGRGAGLHCIIIGQSMPDLEACLQDKAKAQQVLANLNTKIQLRAGLPVDAEEFSKSASKVTVEVIARSGFGITPGVGQSGHKAIQGYSANESYRCDLKEVPKIPPEAITGMPRGQAFISMMGEVYYVAQGMFPKPACNMKIEYQMTAAGPDDLGYIPLFDKPIEGLSDGRAKVSFSVQYRLPPITKSSESEGFESSRRASSPVERSQEGHGATKRNTSAGSGKASGKTPTQDSSATTSADAKASPSAPSSASPSSSSPSDPQHTPTGWGGSTAGARPSRQPEREFEPPRSTTVDRRHDGEDPFVV